VSDHQALEDAGLIIPGLPRTLRWLAPASRVELTAARALRMEAGPHTDWFIDPGAHTLVHNAPALLMPAPGPWQFSAVVSADHRATFDAGVLFVHIDDVTWAKLCLELSPQGEVMVVSVVTRGTSDDCNSVPVEGHSLHLRVSALERAFAFHWSPDGRAWHLVRYFSLGDGAPSQAGVGFIVQSPTGEGCTAEFADITFRPELLADLRSGV
jgi:regulation of enolase protein 1 (concanavalin A-like superfamily)